MQKLSKSEFMSKYINDYYKKKLKEKDIDSHIIENTIKVQESRRKYR